MARDQSYDAPVSMQRIAAQETLSLEVPLEACAREYKLICVGAREVWQRAKPRVGRLRLRELRASQAPHTARCGAGGCAWIGRWRVWRVRQSVRRVERQLF